MSDTLTVPDELKLPRLRFWGDRKPPKNRADMFSCRVAKDAADMSSGADSSVALTGSVATLRIYGPIDSYGGWWGISARDVASALDQLPDDVVELRVRINSPGGEVWEAMAILNMIRAHRARSVAVVDGLAASAGSVVAAGCEETVMSPGTQMMIHDASGFAFGNAATMAKAQKFLDSTSNAIASIYSEAAGGTDEAWRALMVDETWYTAQEAVDSGLADRVAVVSDAGETSTAGDEPEPTVIIVDPDGGEVEDLFDLSIYNHAGRSHAPAPKPPTASAGGFIPTQEGSPAVAFSDEQVTNMRQKLGIAEDADEATILAALDEALDERASDERASDEPPASTATVVATQVPQGMALVDGTLLEQLQAGAAAGQTAQSTLANQERDRVINQALQDGKIAATSRDRFVEAWDKDAASTRSILDALTPGLVPTAEVGHETDPDMSDLDPELITALDAYAAQMGLPKEALHG